MSLALGFGVTVATQPNTVPYLSVSPQKKAEWEQKLGAKTMPRIGLVWSGGPGHVYDYRRTIAREMLQPLLQHKMAFHCLQKEIRAEDLAHLGPIQNHISMLQDFTDTAALIEQMDLVITVDTSVAHLAGALGKPTWILLSEPADYRWLTGRDDSPLYPTARLFRQNVIGDWSGPLAAVNNALVAFA